MAELNGVVPAIPTPLLTGEDVDVDGLRRVIDYVIDQGASGVFVLGSMGEGPALLDSEKRRVVETAAEHVNKRVPLFAGISEISTRRTLELGRMLQDLQADYLVTTGPFYYRFPHPDSIIEFMEALADELTTPLVFYNSPATTGNPVTVDTMDRILNIPNVAAAKDSSRDIHMVMELLRRYPDKSTRPASIFQGDEFVYDMTLLMGADGVITGGGTVFVSTLVELYQAAVNGDKLKAFALQREFRRKMDEMLGPELAIDWMSAVKTRLKQMGLCDSVVTSPFLRRR